MVTTQCFDPLEDHEPRVLKTVGFRFDLPCDEVSHILEHADRDQIIIDVVTSIRCVKMDGV